MPGSVPPAQLAAALGLFYAAFYLGMAARQPLAGLLRDITGSPAAPLFFAAATMVLTVVALGAFRWIGSAASSLSASVSCPGSPTVSGTGHTTKAQGFPDRSSDDE